MADTQFSLSWEAHKKNICSGLSSLQQNGEFVDMTLAADGHHVKVHQVIIALASPYIKELIASAQCQHPVIFLNKISYTTLTAILEYIYTGETLVTKENLQELVQAGKELHIKGLQDMKLELSNKPIVPYGFLAKLKNSDQSDNKDDKTYPKSPPDFSTNFEDEGNDGNDALDPMDTDEETDNATPTNSNKSTEKDTSSEARVQYTISNQGSIQLILNRYIYSLQYSSRIQSRGHRNWICVDNRNTKCNASVITKGDYVVRRIRAHNHMFHDKKILKKVQANAVFSTIREAEVVGQNKKNQRSNPEPTPTSSTDK